MNFLIVIIYSINSFAGFEEATKDSLYQYKLGPKKKVFKRASIKKSQRSNQLDELLAKDKAIYELLKRQEKRVIVRKKEDKVIALTRVRGTLLNSVLAMNVRPSKFIVRVTDPTHDLDAAELRCLGFSFEKRIPSKCDLLIQNEEEFKVDVEIWDLDGAQGIIADYFYTGEEKSFLTSSFAAFLGSTFSVAKSGINTSIGNISQNSAKNQIMDGLLGVSDNARQNIVESGEKDLTISYVNSGKEVLIFFNKSLNLSKEK